MDDLSTATAIDIERRFDLEPGTLGAALTCMLGELPAGLCIQDTRGNYRFVSQQMADLFERPLAKMINGHGTDWLDSAEVEELRSAEQVASRQSGALTSTHLLRIGGQRRSFVVTRRAMQNLDKAGPAWLCSIWRELDGGQTASAAALQVSVAGAGVVAGREDNAGEYDFAAASVGPYQFDDQLRREHDLSSREHREFALVAIAIDRQVPASTADDDPNLRQMAQRVEDLLRGNIRAMDSSFRVATNLFFMILSGVGLATAHSRVEALRRQCADKSAALGDDARRSSISIGVASYPHTSRDREEIVRAAKTALGVAQRRGGNQVALARITFESD